jgi:misacylated tRNA(Ala) deacylase
MPTHCLFHDDAYMHTCEARAIALTGDGGIVLDRTVFYAADDGQPGDSGTLTSAKGALVPISTAIYADHSKNEVIHVPARGSQPIAVGDTVTARIDWDKRYSRMRMHTALHLLAAALPHEATETSIGDGEGEIDFHVPENGLDKDIIAARINEMIAADAPVIHRWMSDVEFEAHPILTRLAPIEQSSANGRKRLILIAGLDLQPCGGTHVRSTSEIGPVRVTHIEKKDSHRRRVRLALL